MQKTTAFKLILIIHVLTTPDKQPLNIQIYLDMIYILKLLHQEEILSAGKEVNLSESYDNQLLELVVPSSQS